MKTNKSAASSQRERLIQKSEADIQEYLRSPKFEEDIERSRAHGPDPTAEDLEEIPLLTDEELDSMRPVNESVTLHINREVLAWLRAKGDQYQSYLNAILREAMQRDLASRQRR